MINLTILLLFILLNFNLFVFVKSSPMIPSNLPTVVTSMEKLPNYNVSVISKYTIHPKENRFPVYICKIQNNLPNILEPERLWQFVNIIGLFLITSCTFLDGIFSWNHNYKKNIDVNLFPVIILLSSKY